MRILIDECVDQRLRNYFPGRECQTAQHAGFGGLKNGDLLRAGEAAEFDVLLTVDRGMEYQQDLYRRNIVVMIIHAKSNRLKDLFPHIPACLHRLESIQPGQIVTITD